MTTNPRCLNCGRPSDRLVNFRCPTLAECAAWSTEMAAARAAQAPKVVVPPRKPATHCADCKAPNPYYATHKTPRCTACYRKAVAALDRAMEVREANEVRFEKRNASRLEAQEQADYALEDQVAKERGLFGSLGHSSGRGRWSR